MGKLSWVVLIAAILVAVSGCWDTVVTPDAPDQGPQAAWSALTASDGTLLQSRLDGLAAGVAAAAMDGRVRDELFFAFQASGRPEGKVHLHAVAEPGTQFGQRLWARFGPMGGWARAIEGLPPLDFYVGRREDRVTWRPGAATVAVVAVANPDQRWAIAHFSDGRTQRVSGPGDVRADVLLLIHPTEQTLQSMEECDPETSIIPCDDGGGSGWGGGGGGDPTDVFSFEVNFGDWWGDAEVEFRGAGFCGASEQASGTFRRTGVERYVVYAGGTMISGWSPALCGGDGRVHVQLWETDPLDQDDYFGSAQWYQSEHGAMKYFIFWGPNGWARVVWTIP